MTPILDILKTTAEGLNLFFFNALPSFQNMQGGKEDNREAICYLSEPLISQHELKETGGAYLISTWPLEFYFLKYSDLEMTQGQHDPIIAEMRSKATAYIRALHNATIPEDGRLAFSVINSIEMENVINLYSDNFSGVKVSISVVELIPESLC